MAQFTAPHGLPRRGQTFYKGQTPPSTYAESRWAEGTMAQFKQYTDAGAVGADSTTSNHFVMCRLVRNTATIVLEPKRLVSWEASYIGRRVDGYVTLDNAKNVAGVVDDRLTYNVPVGDMFWLIVSGPALIKSNIANYAADIEPLDHIVSLTAATSQATTAGRFKALVLTTTNDVTGMTQNSNWVLASIGRALSKCTTTHTNQDVLCYLDLLKA